MVNYKILMIGMLSLSCWFLFTVYTNLIAVPSRVLFCQYLTNLPGGGLLDCWLIIIGMEGIRCTSFPPYCLSGGIFKPEDATVLQNRTTIVSSTNQAPRLLEKRCLLLLFYKVIVQVRPVNLLKWTPATTRLKCDVRYRRTQYSNFFLLISYLRRSRLLMCSEMPFPSGPFHASEQMILRLRSGKEQYAHLCEKLTAELAGHFFSASHSFQSCTIAATATTGPPKR